MIQTIPKCVSTIGFGSVAYFTGLNAGDGVLSTGGGRIPLCFPTTVRNLALYDGVGFQRETTATVFKNGSSTLLTTSLLAGAADRQAFDDVHSVIYAPGDYAEYQIAVSSTILSPGDTGGVVVDLDAPEMQFGIPPGSGTISVGAGWYGGALGNGFFSTYPGVPTGVPASYSICALTCTLDAICLRRFTSAYSGGSWVARIILTRAGVSAIQDGSGGTVDTTTTLLDIDTFTVNTSFALPLIPGDHVNLVLLRAGTTALFSAVHVGAGIGVTPTTPGQFMFTGGSNDTIPPTGTTWKWNLSRQNGATIGVHTAPAGRTGFVVTGAYIERNNPAGVGDAWVHTLLKNGVGTDVNLTIGDTGTSGLITGVEAVYAAGDVLTNEILNTGTPAGAQFHWGLSVAAFVEPEPPAENDCPEQVSAGCWSPHSADRLTVELDGDYDL